MNNVDRFYNDGILKINVNYNAIEGAPIICLNNGLWYKFQIEKVEELEDGTFDIITTKLISIDEELIKY